MCRHCQGQIMTLATTYLLPNLHQTEESYKVPKEKTKMGFGEIICPTTKSVGYSRRETRSMGCESGNAEVQWNNIKECVLHTISNLVGKVEKRARKPWITQDGGKKEMEKVNTEEGRKN
jgi:hypothetical protein